MEIIPGWIQTTEEVFNAIISAHRLDLTQYRPNSQDDMPSIEWGFREAEISFIRIVSGRQNDHLYYIRTVRKRDFL